MTIIGVSAAVFFAFWLRTYPIHNADGDNRAPWGAYLYAIAALVLVHLLGACSIDNNEPEPRVYTCTVVYRCAGATNLEARLAMPCAGDRTEAEDIASEATIAAMVDNCGAADGWAYVRPLCEPYEPQTACDPAH